MLGHRRVTLILGTYMHNICTPAGWRKILLELSVPPPPTLDRMLVYRRFTLGNYVHSICFCTWVEKDTVRVKCPPPRLDRMLGHRRVTLILDTYMHSICTPGWRKILLELSVMPRSEPGLLNQELSAQTKTQPCTTLGQY